MLITGARITKIDKQQYSQFTDYDLPPMKGKVEGDGIKVGGGGKE